MSNDPPIIKASALSLLSAFNEIGKLVKSQRSSVEKFDASSSYATDKEEAFTEEIIEFYRSSLRAMGVAERDELAAWQFSIRFASKNIVDPLAAYANLRLLPDEDVRKFRLFNRFAGQEVFRISVSDIIYHQIKSYRGNSNPFFEALQRRVNELAQLCGKPPYHDKMDWPERTLEGSDRENFLARMRVWRDFFINLPGIKDAAGFFANEDGPRAEIFSHFFHIQRQFDSSDWQDYEPGGEPYPQPIPRIASYRKAIYELNNEFVDSESTISMCYDYCRMKSSAIIPYIREAEDSFLKIVNRLDEDYPKEVDWGHFMLHERALSLKHMLFPMRCLFFEELDDRRGVQESNDNTLDSYFEMSLGSIIVSIPEHYCHTFKIAELEIEIRPVIEEIENQSVGMGVEVRNAEGIYSADRLVGVIQRAEQTFNQQLAEKLSPISLEYETRFKNDENNLSRRIGRLLWLFSSALAKKSDMASACKSRLDSVHALSMQYSERASRLAEVDLTEDAQYMALKDDELPLLASPEQMENLYNTRKVVSRLAEGASEFQSEAQNIDAGLEAALKMLKQAEAFLEHLVKRIFPNEIDRIDLMQAIKKLISLSYNTQQALANAAKKALVVQKKRDASGDLKSELNEDSKIIRGLKQEVDSTRSKLEEILAEKRGLIEIMRITKDEKANYKKQLRMITVMTINSMKAQKGENV